MPETTRFHLARRERIKTKDDIFPPEENEENEKIIKASQAEMAKENTPMKVRKETKDYDKNNPQPKPKQQRRSKLPSYTRPR
jgi:hypothetical protein